MGKFISPKSGQSVSTLIQSLRIPQLIRLLCIHFHYLAYRLDTQLYRACHNDAIGLCGAPPEWFETAKADVPTAEVDPHIFPCLYGHLPYKIKEHREKLEEEGIGPEVMFTIVLSVKVWDGSEYQF